MKARALAVARVPGLERFGGSGMLDDVVDPGADVVHLSKVGDLGKSHRVLERHGAFRHLPGGDRLISARVGPHVVDQIHLKRLAADQLR